jgi:mutual gliding-motility protein MglA
VDGIVFVADSQAERMDANLASMQNLYENLAEYGYDPRQLPMVLQYNKRDLPSRIPLDELSAQLNPGGLEEYESVATEGEGVFDTLRAVSKQVIKALS